MEDLTRNIPSYPRYPKVGQERGHESDENEKQKQKLIELGVMEPEDTRWWISFQASYVERLVGKLGKWKQGWV